MDRESSRSSNQDKRVINRPESQLGHAQKEENTTASVEMNKNDTEHASDSVGGRHQVLAKKTEPAKPKKVFNSLKFVNKFSKNKVFVWCVAIVILLMLGGLAVWLTVSSTVLSTAKTNPVTGIDSGKYQAVLLSNGESYFGKLTNLNDDFMKLDDIYYLKVKDGSTVSAQDAAEGNFQLIKLGAEVQGPEDEMIISKKQIVYYENMKPDGKAAQAIKKYQDSLKK